MRLVRAPVVLAGLVAVSTAGAQDLYVGSNSSGVVTNFGAATNAFASTYVGFATNASNNVLEISNAGTLVTNSGTVFAGYGGSGNRLWVSGGAVLASASGYVGQGPSSSSNSVLLHGAGTVWSNTGALYVGYWGQDNALTVSGGAVLLNTTGNIGYAGGATGNEVLVAGAGSLWSMTDHLYIGRSGATNSLTVSSGGEVSSFRASIGSGSAGNSVTLSGSGSRWTVESDLGIGRFYEGNTLLVSNGAVLLTGSAIIGDRSSADENHAVLTGSGSRWTNTGPLVVGRQGSSNSLTVSDGAALVTGSLTLASEGGSGLALNFGTFGGAASSGTVETATIAFGAGSGTVNFNQADSNSLAAAISGGGEVRQLGSGMTTLTGSNSYTGATTVAAGTLELDGEGGAAGNTASVSVDAGAVLLVSRADQVADAASVTLSGGTILRGSGVSEVFGDLELAAASFLDFGTGAAGQLTFGDYTPSSLLTVENFLPGNALAFVGAGDLSTAVTDTNLFVFADGAGFATDFSGGTFTITAIPEPSGVVAWAMLLAMSAVLRLVRRGAGSRPGSAGKAG